MKTLLGIDPGKNGALCLKERVKDGVVKTSVFKMPDTEHEVAELLTLFKSLHSELEVFIEEVGGFAGRGQPGSAMFVFGRGFGFLLGCLSSLKIKYTLVKPQKWQKFFGVGTKGEMTTTQWKNKLWQRACELHAGTKILKSQGDAVLISEYGWFASKD